MQEGAKERQLKQNIEDTQYTIKRIKQVSSSLRYRGKQRINQTALFEVEIKHTNEFTIKLGCDYFVQLRAEDAIKLLEYRLKNYQQELSKTPKKLQPEQSSNSSQMNEQIQQLKKVKENRGSYVECIGQENGQNIFNIVEVEGEQDEQLQQAQKSYENNSSATSVQQKTQKDKKHQQQSLEDKPFKKQQKRVSFVENKPQQITNKERSADRDQQFNQQIDQQENLDTFSEDQEEEDQNYGQDDEYDDIMLSHRAKLGIHPDLDKKELNSIKKCIDLPEKLADEAQKEGEKEEIKERKSSSKETAKQEKKEIEAPLPQKISRFKLERMKQKLEQYL